MYSQKIHKKVAKHCKSGAFSILRLPFISSQRKPHSYKQETCASFSIASDYPDVKVII